MTVVPLRRAARRVEKLGAELWLAFGAPVATDRLSTTSALGGDVLDARDAVSAADELLDVWLARDRDELRAGLQLYTDGALWTDGACDGFADLAGWGVLGHAALDGVAITVPLGRGGTLRARPEDDRLVLWDEQGGTGSPVSVAPRPLAEAIAEVGLVLDGLRTAIAGALDARERRSGPDPRTARVRAELVRGVDPAPFRELAWRLGLR